MLNKWRKNILQGLSAIALCLFVSGCNALFFFPTRHLIVTPAKIGLDFENVHLKVATDVTLHGWYIPAKGYRKGTILFFHGNGENISSHFASVYWLPAQGYEIFLFDYRGYGLSESYPSVETAIDDAVTQIDFLERSFHIDPQQLVVFGQSLGGAVAINAVARVAQTRQVGALIVDSSFTGFRRIAREKLNDFWLTWPLQGPLSRCFTGEYESIDAIRTIHGIPVLVIHSRADEVIPFVHGEQLYNAANEPKQFWQLEGFKHIYSTTNNDIREKFLRYLEFVLASPTNTADRSSVEKRGLNLP